MADDKTYNGWTNYETWLVNLWLDNSQGDHEYWQERAQEAWNDAEPGKYEWQTRENEAKEALAEELKSWHEELAAELHGNAGLFSDLIGAALGSVEWREIAGHMLDEVDHSEDEAEAA